MRKEKIDKMLYELGEQTEPVRPGLRDDIKQQIPHRLLRHRFSWDTVSIIIDLRMSRSTAAAVIIVTMVLLLNLFNSRDPMNGGIFRDGVLLLKYWRNDMSEDISTAKTKYEHFLSLDQDVTWYGDSIENVDKNTVLIQLRLPDGRYKIVYIDGREKEVDAEELVEILSGMLKKSN